MVPSQILALSPAVTGHRFGCAPIVSAYPSPIRESMRRLPTVLQPFLTWLTGKPLAGERAWRLTHWDHLASALVALVFGVALSLLAATQLGWWVLAFYPGWLLTVHSVRKLRAVIAHQCAHTNFSGNQRLDTFISEAVSILFLTQSYHSYRHEHVHGHHSKKHMTVDDPTVLFMLKMVGMRPGMSPEKLWLLMIGTIFSPLFHLAFIVTRLSSNLRHNSWTHRIATVVVWGSLVTAVALTGTWGPFLLAWVLPLTLILHTSECLRLCSRHIYPSTSKLHRDREALAGFTHGIFAGDAAPDPELPILERTVEWAIWWLRLVFVQLPARMLVLVGDATCHDYHHRYPRAKNWARYIHAREEKVRDGDPGWPAFTEVWGLRRALDATFESLSQADPAEYDLAKIGRVRMYELLESFEE